MKKITNRFLTDLCQLNQKKIVLASQSPRRIELLRSVGLTFEVLPSKINEEMSEKIDSLQFVRNIALKKAQSVWKKANADLVIAADTIVTMDNQLFGKPKNAEDAAAMLTKLSGRIHHVISGFCVLTKAEKIIDHEITKVTFNRLTAEEIDAYLATKEYADKAGAYGIQGLASLFVKKIDGCYFNVVGFPLGKFYQSLKNIKIN
jgi:septum formation protein